MITIHGSPISPFVRKTLVCLAEKGIEFENNPVMPFPPPESHLKISPLGKIPALTDGGLAFTARPVATRASVARRFRHLPVRR